MTNTGIAALLLCCLLTACETTRERPDASTLADAPPRCAPGCPAFDLCCADVCRDIESDRDNCGGCGIRCDGTCERGACVAPEYECTPGCYDRHLCCPTEIGLFCIEPDTERTHCGRCGVRCIGACVDGICVD